jgi:hypothetical protein
VKVLNKFNHLNIKEANTLYDVFFKLIEHIDRSIAQIEYASAIDNLMSCTVLYLILLS